MPNLKIGTLNVLMLTRKVEELMGLMRKRKLYVWGLSEMKRKRQGEKDMRGRKVVLKWEWQSWEEWSCHDGEQEYTKIY